MQNRNLTQALQISELEAKIEHSRTMRDKFIQMRPLLKDRNVISDCETQIKEYQKYIDYFTEELHRLEAKQDNASDSGSESPVALQQQNQLLQAQSEHPPRTSSMSTNPSEVTVVAPRKKDDKKKYSNLGKYQPEKKTLIKVLKI